MTAFISEDVRPRTLGIGWVWRLLRNRTGEGCGLGTSPSIISCLFESSRMDRVIE